MTTNIKSDDDLILTNPVVPDTEILPELSIKKTEPITKQKKVISKQVFDLLGVDAAGQKLLDVENTAILQNNQKDAYEKVQKKMKSGLGVRDELNKHLGTINDSIFVIDKTLTKEELQRRLEEIDNWIWFCEKLPNNEIGEFLHEKGIIDIDEKNGNNSIYGEIITTKVRVLDIISSGVENENRFSLGDDNTAGIIKETKERHDKDPLSILYLLRFMYLSELKYNIENISSEEQNSQNENVQISIETATDSMGFFVDEKGNYKRVISQKFAEGDSLDIALKKEFGLLIYEKNFISSELFNKKIKEGNSLAIAYKTFLRHIDKVGKEEGFILDITDSRIGAVKERGNVLNTGNIFVKKDEDGKFKFTIVDPDVFNKDGKHKFRGKLILNKARQLVLKRQDEFLSEIGIGDKPVNNGLIGGIFNFLLQKGKGITYDEVIR